MSLSTNGPVETKVYAALVGGVSGGAIGGFVLWLLGITVWHVSNAAASSGAAAAAVPPPVADILLWGLPGAVAWGAAWLAPHTSRPDLATPTATPTMGTPTMGTLTSSGVFYGSGVAPAVEPPPTSAPIIKVT